MNAISATVRFVQDKSTSRCWFQEKLQTGQWQRITETECACEENARFRLKKVMEERIRLLWVPDVGPEETITVHKPKE